MVPHATKRKTLPAGRLTMQLPKKIIYWHPPSWDSGLCFRNIPVPVYRRIIRIAGTVHFDHIGAEQIYVPYNQRATREIVIAFCFHLPLSCWAVVTLTPHFRGKYRRTIEKLHTPSCTHIIGRIRAERLAMWEVDLKPDPVSQAKAAPSASRIRA